MTSYSLLLTYVMEDPYESLLLFLVTNLLPRAQIITVTSLTNSLPQREDVLEESWLEVRHLAFIYSESSVFSQTLKIAAVHVAYHL